MLMLPATQMRRTFVK